MSLETDINQQSFSSDYLKAIVNIIYTYSWITERQKKFFDAESITAQQYNIMRILRGAGVPISTLQIRQRMLDKMSDTSRIVDRLVAKGIALKSTTASDKRLVDVMLTKKGHIILSRMDEISPQMLDVMSNLSTDESKLLNNLLDKIRG